ncbi:MAG: pilus assembly protein PilM [Pseudomonadota bacterium]
MFAFARRKRTDFIGLDISSDAIRLLQLKLRRNGWVVKNYATAPLTAGSITDGKIKQPQEVQAVIARLVSETKTAGCLAALALPANAVISQQITLPPRLPPLDYEIAITANLARYFPGVTDALCFDFLTMQGSDATRQEIFLVAARQWQVESYAALVNAAGLRVKVIDVDRFALIRAVPLTVAEFNEHHAVVLIHFAKQHADLIIFSKRIILLEQRWHREDALAFSDTVKQALNLYFSAAPKKIDYVVLSGELPEEAGPLADYFRGEAGLKIFLVDPLRKMQMAAKVDRKKIQDDASNLQICCGLATRRFQ